MRKKGKMQKKRNKRIDEEKLDDKGINKCKIERNTENAKRTDA
jgi:hypothetical protein